MKKVLYYLIIMLAFTLNACDNEMDNMQGGDKEILTSSSEIVIKDGKITYPKWLVNVVDSVAHSHVKGTQDYKEAVGSSSLSSFRSPLSVL